MKFWTKFLALFRRRHLEDDLAEEMRLHLEHRFEENIAAGLTPADARNAALRRFGGVEQARERCRDQTRWTGLEQFAQDFRFAARSLRKTPGFTAVAVITLALGIGLNVAMFSLADAALLRTLPFPEPDDLVRLYRTTPRNDRGGFSRADYLDIKRDESRFGRLAAYYFSAVSLSEPGQPAEWQNTLRVSADFFDILGVRAEIGRTFRPEEEAIGRHRVIVISHGYWRDRFGGDPGVLGRIVRCNGEPFEIIGVLPAAAHDQRLFGNARLFRPLGFTDRDAARRDIAFLNLLARRDPSLSPSEGEARIAAFGTRLASDHPAENSGSGWRAVGLQASTRKPPVPALVGLLLALSAFVLLIACSNLANFFLARALARLRESAVRVALGASQGRLLRALLAECLLLAAFGGAGALLVMQATAVWFNEALVRSGDSPVAFAMNGRVLGFAFVASLAAVAAFGLAAALFTRRITAQQALKSGASPGATASRGLQRFRHALIVGQFGLAAVLVAGAGCFVFGLDRLTNQQRGWTDSAVVQAWFQLPASAYPTELQIDTFERRTLERLSALPGVRAASLSYALPYRGFNCFRRYQAEGAATGVGSAIVPAEVNGISPNYFETTGTRLLRGRLFNERDTPGSPLVVIVSESLANALFPSGNALGRRVAQAEQKPLQWAEIVGIVADVHPVTLGDAAASGQCYEPMAQDHWYNGDGKLAELYIAVRTEGITPDAMVGLIRAAMAGLDADLPLRDLLPAPRLIERTLGSIGMLRNLLLVFATLGLLLAVLGLYGVIARTVAQRTPEIGIRLALGAQVGDVIRLVVGSGLRQALVGALLGVAGGWGISRVITSTFPALSVNSVLVLFGTALLLVIVALAGSYFPARRAARVDPLAALRAE